MKFIKPFFEVKKFEFKFSEIRYYFDELLDNGWEVCANSAVGLNKVNLNSKLSNRPNYSDFTNIDGFKMGVIVQKKKKYRSDQMANFEVDSGPDGVMIGDSPSSHWVGSWNYEEEIGDMIELIDRLEEIKDRMEEDGFKVWISKRDRDDRQIEYDKSVMGAYLSIVRYEKAEKITESKNIGILNTYQDKYDNFDFDFIHDCLQELLDGGWKIENISEPKKIEQSNDKQTIDKHYTKILLNKIKKLDNSGLLNLHCKDQLGRTTSSHINSWDIEKEIQELDTIADSFLEIKDRLEEMGYKSCFSKNNKNYSSMFLHIIK